MATAGDASGGQTLVSAGRSGATGTTAGPDVTETGKSAGRERTVRLTSRGILWTDDEVERVLTDARKRIGPRHVDMMTWRRAIHAYPELAFEEERTAEMVAGLLAEWGYDVDRSLGSTGVVGTLTVGDGGSAEGGEAEELPPAIMLRCAIARVKCSVGGVRGMVWVAGGRMLADMDALPMEEGNAFEHRSQRRSTMHACGHDGHTAMLLGAARYLAEHRPFRGKIHVVFQPAEEGTPTHNPYGREGGGALAMLEDGLLEKYPVRAAFGMHNWPGLPVGRFAVHSGPVMAGVENFHITVGGTGCHAAMPHLGGGSDPVLAAANLVTNLQALVSRVVEPHDSAVVSVTQIHAGDAFNVIPPSAEVKGTLRTYRGETREAMMRGIERMAHGVTAAHGCTATVRFCDHFPATVNTPREAQEAAAAARAVVGAALVDLDSRAPSMGAEDFGYILERVPALVHLDSRAPSMGAEDFGYILERVAGEESGGGLKRLLPLDWQRPHGRRLHAAQPLVSGHGSLRTLSHPLVPAPLPTSPSLFAPLISFYHAFPSPPPPIAPVAAPFHSAALPVAAAAAAEQNAGGGGGGTGGGGAEGGGGGEGRKEEDGEWRQWIQQALSKDGEGGGKEGREQQARAAVGGWSIAQHLPSASDFDELEALIGPDEEEEEEERNGGRRGGEESRGGMRVGGERGERGEGGRGEVKEEVEGSYGRGGRAGGYGGRSGGGRSWGEGEEWGGRAGGGGEGARGRYGGGGDGGGGAGGVGSWGGGGGGMGGGMGGGPWQGVAEVEAEMVLSDRAMRAVREVDLEESEEKFQFRPDRTYYPGQTYSAEELDISQPLPDGPGETRRKLPTPTTKEALRAADFRNVRFLSQFLSETGKIKPRNKTRLSAKAQRRVAREIRTARVFGLMPFTQAGRPPFRFGKDPNLESGEPEQEELELAGAVEDVKELKAMAGR
ncbi:unnamed protein product [Closterium sp. Naga37s-1]|nr:unnamed protein product [Closterium sp. Naga37s-1]